MRVLHGFTTRGLENGDIRDQRRSYDDICEWGRGGGDGIARLADLWLGAPACVLLFVDR